MTEAGFEAIPKAGPKAGLKAGPEAGPRPDHGGRTREAGSGRPDRRQRPDQRLDRRPEPRLDLRLDLRKDLRLDPWLGPRMARGCTEVGLKDRPEAAPTCI